VKTVTMLTGMVMIVVVVWAMVFASRIQLNEMHDPVHIQKERTDEKSR